MVELSSESIAGWRCRELRVVAAKLPDGRQSGLAEKPDRGRCSAKHANVGANFELSHPRPRLSLTLHSCSRRQVDSTRFPRFVTERSYSLRNRPANETCERNPLAYINTRAESRVERERVWHLNRARPRCSPFLLITGSARFSAASIRRDIVYSNFASRKLYWKLAKASAGGRLRLHTHISHTTSCTFHISASARGDRTIPSCTKLSFWTLSPRADSGTVRMALLYAVCLFSRLRSATDRKRTLSFTIPFISSC